jgi:TonB family protein
MNRVFTAALIGAAFFAFAHCNAVAATQLCPGLKYERVGARDDAGRPGALYGIEITDAQPRTVTRGTLAFDTSAGWFTAAVANLTIQEKDRHYSAPSISFVRHDYVSPKIYARFPQAIAIAHAWLYEASMDGNSSVICAPPPGSSPSQSQQAARARRHWDSEYALSPNDRDNLSEAPGAGALMLNAAPSKPLERTDCDEPFRDATVKTQAVPRYPREMSGSTIGFGPVTNAVQVQIDGDGSLIDAQIWAPSGFAAFDQASLDAVKASTYQGARSYCLPVPGTYFFHVTFDPN